MRKEQGRLITPLCNSFYNMVDELDSLIVAHEFWALFPFRRCNINKTAHFVWLFSDNDSSLKFFQLERTVVPMKLESRPWKSPNGQRKEMVFLGFPLSHVIGIWSKFDNWLVTTYLAVQFENASVHMFAYSYATGSIILISLSRSNLSIYEKSIGILNYPRYYI